MVVVVVVVRATCIQGECVNRLFLRVSWNHSRCGEPEHSVFFPGVPKCVFIYMYLVHPTVK